MTKRKKVGEEAYERLLNPDTKQGVVDTQREADKEYFQELKKTVDAHKSWDFPYFIIVMNKKERLMENVVRRYFFARRTLPQPTFDCTVWRYDPKTSDLTFLWVIPDRDTCMWMASNPEDIHPEQRHLLGYVMDMLDKKLYRHYHALYEREESSDVVLSS